jgi:hypothetical protein
MFIISEVINAFDTMFKVDVNWGIGGYFEKLRSLNAAMKC